MSDPTLIILTALFFAIAAGSVAFLIIGDYGSSNAHITKRLSQIGVKAVAPQYSIGQGLMRGIGSKLQGIETKKNSRATSRTKLADVEGRFGDVPAGI
jgi:hypothetical protein